MTWVSLRVSVPFTNLTGDGGRLSRDRPGGWCDYVGVTTATVTDQVGGVTMWGSLLLL